MGDLLLEGFQLKGTSQRSRKLLRIKFRLVNHVNWVSGRHLWIEVGRERSKLELRVEVHQPSPVFPPV